MPVTFGNGVLPSLYKNNNKKEPLNGNTRTLVCRGLVHWSPSCTNSFWQATTRPTISVALSSFSRSKFANRPLSFSTRSSERSQPSFPSHSLPPEVSSSPSCCHARDMFARVTVEGSKTQEPFALWLRFCGIEYDIYIYSLFPFSFGGVHSERMSGAGIS